MLGVAIAQIYMKSSRNDMSSHAPDDTLLLIRCPSCGQRFKVGDDLRERTVECGGCEHRFRIDDEVIVRGRKFYPSEQKSHELNRFARIPLPGGEALIGTQPVRYSNMPDPAVLEPASPQRIMAGIIGVAGMVLMALLLMFGASRGGVLDGMVIGSRLLMAGFASVLGTLLLVYANPRARMKALGVALVLSVALSLVPFFFKTGSVPRGNRTAGAAGVSAPTIHAPIQQPGEDSATLALRARIGTAPLVAEIQKLALDGSGKQAVGLWFRGLSESNRFLVRDYILRVTEADPASHYYPRDGGDYLLVVTGIRKSLPELAELTSALGQTEKIYTDLSVIEVRVRNDIFVEGSIEKLSKKEDPAFYDLNKRELESIDLDRVRRAVQRLAEADPKIYRADISRKLISLLGQDGLDFKGNICSALMVWSELPGPASEAALIEVKKLVAKAETVPPEIVGLIVKERNTGIIPILDELWYKNPVAWESFYSELGQPVEEAVIKRFPDTSGTIRYSAVRILGRVGGSRSLSVLTAEMSGKDPELKVLIEQSKKSIAARLGE
jgi:hypothetical protein